MEATGIQEINSLTLPMPQNLSIEFIPICVNINNGFFDSKRIKLGDPSGGFKESPTSMALGGSFPIEQNGKDMWCYYLSKYELTKPQYNSIMNPNQTISTDKKLYPITNISWFDAIEFGNLYNQWLFKNAKDKIPKFDTTYGFVRLPTEAEWEFAARGGSIVSNDFFDQKIPYDSKKLQEYEWFAGPTSSHNKLQPIGKLKPNPLGLYDMLGNADEITISLFQVEYYQGRTGGFVIKGNNYITAKKRFRSSFRTEQAFYRPLIKEGILKPQTKPTLGFRLALSALVLPSRKVITQMSDQWEDYHKKVGVNTPAVLSTKPISVQTSVDGNDALIYINRVEKSLNLNNTHDVEIKNNLEHIKASINSMAIIQKKAEEDSAYLWVKIASEQARFINKETTSLPKLELLIEIANSQNRQQKIEKYKLRKSEHLTNISGALSSYSDSIRQINTLSISASKKGFIRYFNFLRERNDARQIQILNKVKKHFKEYQKNKRSNIKKWKQDILFY